MKETLKNSGIDLEGMFSECGPGQQEVNIHNIDITFTSSNA